MTEKKEKASRKQGRVRRMTPDQVRKTAQAMLDAEDPAKADRLEEQLVRGFCGDDAE